MEHPIPDSEETIHIVYSNNNHYDAVLHDDQSEANEPLQLTSSTLSNFHDYATIASTPSSTPSTQCPYCEQDFATKQTRNNHIKSFHSGKSPKNSVNCIVPSCNGSFASLELCMKHLKASHGANIIITEHDFSNVDEFMKFKSNEERKSNCIFVKCRGNIKSKKSTTSCQYICHRDGHTRIHLKKGESFKGTRSKNQKGSCKIGGLCPARFYYLQKQNNSVHVRYIHNHAHSISFNQSKFVPIPHHVRDDIAIKLSLNIPINTILDTIQSSLNSREDRDSLAQRLHHYHLIDRKTILNIKKSMQDSSYQLHEDDATSVMLKVQSMKSEKYDPILLYKPQGQLDQSMTPALSEDDFMLAFMTKEQAEIFNKFSNVILCMDSTHQTNAYKFKLITLMVPDEFRRGYPVAFCISNKETAPILTLFLQRIKERCPNAKVNTLMTDDDLAGISAATNVFGNVNHYLCIWHVHQSWRRKLRSIINENDKATIYAYLCAMLEAKTENDYRRLYDNFVTRFEHVYPDFFSYFQATYAGRPEKWALCFRNHEYANVNTNMFVESFHNKLKSVYFEKKQNRRIDRLVETLLRIESHMLLSHFKQVTYNTASCANSANRHENSLQVDDASFCQVNEKTFTLQSSSNPSGHYVIKRTTDVCKESYCNVKCNEFPCINLCYHLYSCTCVDYTRKNLCKHIHKVHSICVQTPSTTTTEDGDDSNDFDNLAPDLPDNNTVEETNHDLLTQEIQNILQRISRQLTHPAIQAQRLHVIKQSALSIEKANNATINLLNSSQVKPISKKDKIAPGTLHTLQPRFRATSGAPGRPKKPRLTAPTEEQKRELLECPPTTTSNPVTGHTTSHTSTSQQVPGERR